MKLSHVPRGELRLSISSPSAVFPASPLSGTEGFPWTSLHCLTYSRAAAQLHGQLQACSAPSDAKAAQHHWSVQLAGQCRTCRTATPPESWSIKDTPGHLREIWGV